MSPLHAVILGLVEGITEYLPVSSTGHLILAAALLGLDDDPLRKQAIDAFLIVVQGGAILAVLGLYRHRVARMLAGIAGRDRNGRRLAINLLVAFLPAAVSGPLLDELIKRHLFHAWPVIAALAGGGVVMIALGPWQRRFFHEPETDDGEPSDARSYVDIEHLTWRRALLIGLLQCVAMWPGTSRSLMTIVGGMLVGLRPRHAAEFSFLLGLPTLGGACVYRLAGELTRDGPSMFEVLGVTPLVIGFAVATISAVLAVRWLVAYLTKHGLALFGWYRLVLCLVLVILIGLDMVEISGAVG